MIAKNEKTKPIRCAIYTRKSHEEGLEQEFNSLDAQRESCEAYIASQKHEGWKALATRYDDGGFTGGNMERPGLKALLADIEAGGVDVVMVYKVDRLSRSLMDFSKLVALFETHDVAFVSVTQHFDTTSSMGRLTLNILLSFAQFERELCGERIRDKIASAKRKGKYVGGRPLLGYNVDHEKMRLLVNDAEAKLVRHIFDRFCRLGSCMLVARELNEQGHRMKAWITKKGKPMGGGMWKKTDVHHLLTNRRYLGEVMYKGESYPGEHDAIVDRKVWDRVQGILSQNRAGRANQTRKTTAAILKGILRCECCDAAMAPTYTTRRGKRYHYYVCHSAAKKGYDTCNVRSVPAGQIEQAVFTYLREIFAAPTVRHDGDAIVIDIPMALRHRGGRKEIVLPPGVAPVAENAAGEESPTALALALARAFRWQEMIESGQAESNSDLARKLKLDQSYIARTIRLACLAPDLVEAIIDSQEPDGLSLRSLRRDLPLAWDEQRRMLVK